MRGPPVLLTAGDIAAKYNVHRATAHRWLREMYVRHGEPTVVRVGNQYRATEASLARWMPDRSTPVSESRMRKLEETVKEHGMQIRVLADENRALRDELRKKAHEWFTNRGKTTEGTSRNVA